MRSLVISPPPATASPQALQAFAISLLPDDQRLVLTLFYFERLSLEEIALLLNESEDEVAAHFYHARSSLDGDLAVADPAVAA